MVKKLEALQELRAKINITWELGEPANSHIRKVNNARKRYYKALDIFATKYDCSIIDLDLTSKLDILKAIKKLNTKHKKYRKLNMDETDIEMIRIVNTLKGLHDVITTI